MPGETLAESDDANRDESFGDTNREEYYKEAEALYKLFLDKRIRIICKSNITIEGTCRSLDGYLNTALEDASYSGTGVSIMETCYVRGAFIQHMEIVKIESDAK